MNNKELGNLGEDVASKYLKEKGYIILKRNFRCKLGEIDIICFKNNKIVFVEVKTRKSLKYGNPSEAVDSRKVLHILNTAKYYISIHKLENFNISFDVIEVYLDYTNIFKINHIKEII